MKSFEHGYLYDTPVSHALLRTMRALQDLRAEGGVRCLGHGPDAEWERTGR